MVWKRPGENTYDHALEMIKIQRQVCWPKPTAGTLTFKHGTEAFCPFSIFSLFTFNKFPPANNQALGISQFQPESPGVM